MLKPARTLLWCVTRVATSAPTPRSDAFTPMPNMLATLVDAAAGVEFSDWPAGSAGAAKALPSKRAVQEIAAKKLRSMAFISTPLNRDTDQGGETGNSRRLQPE